MKKLVEIEKEDFKKKFPLLYEEIENDTASISINESTDLDNKHGDIFKGYIPTAIDYLRRCETNEQAKQTIEYLLKKREITKEYGRKLQKILKEKGLRGFGPKKEDDYYLKKTEIIE